VDLPRRGTLAVGVERLVPVPLGVLASHVASPGVEEVLPIVGATGIECGAAFARTATAAATANTAIVIPGNLLSFISQTQSCLFVRVEHVERVVVRGLLDDDH
jgi:hypothetical protein